MKLRSIVEEDYIHDEVRNCTTMFSATQIP
jgi:hypothetical protein